jgi:hypothetical protein
MTFADLDLDYDDVIVVPTDASPLDFLCRVYRDARQPLSARLKAAGLAAPFMHPKLQVTAMVTEGGDIAERIERARKRSEVILEERFEREVQARLAARAIAVPPMIDAKAEPVPLGRPPTMPRWRECAAVDRSIR